MAPNPHGRHPGGDSLEVALPTSAYRSVLEEHGYEVGKVIGSGSYGTVYEAYYTKQTVMVAVKIISEKKASEGYLNKFLPCEIQVGKGTGRGNGTQQLKASRRVMATSPLGFDPVAKFQVAVGGQEGWQHSQSQVMKVLRHKYLISFYQAIETTSRVYIILELAQGADALEWIQHYRACSEPLAGKWFSQMTLGIAYLHSKGIVHRDFKLESLLLDKRENVKIIGFWLCQDGALLTVAALLMPAQRSCQACPTALSCPITWSMGIILYTLVVAHLPSDDSSLRKLLRDTQKEVTFPSNHSISQECKNLVLQMLRQATKLATILDIIKDPWVLKFQPEQPTHEIRLREAMCQLPNTNPQKKHQRFEKKWRTPAGNSSSKPK
ncbi:hypothetical protein MC885_010510 [Smutsia gigantea]|nr:hypothetical protein MC885_010510 [Smutsia gigantea]